MPCRGYSASMRVWKLHGSGVDDEQSFDLLPPGPVTVGRAIGQSVRLAPRQVSREHAELIWVPASAQDAEHWRVHDLGSSGGTYVNGTRLVARSECRLEHGDLMEIRPWVFRIEDPAKQASPTEPAVRLAREFDTGDERVEEAIVRSPGELAQSQVLQLLEASEHMALATNEHEIGRAAVGAVGAATGFANTALIRPGASDGTIEVLASTGDVVDPSGHARVSWSLLKRSRERPYVLRGDPHAGATLVASIASLNIQQAICVPIDAGGTFLGWLYLDNRGGGRIDAHEHETTGFAAAIARMAGLALSSVARQRMQHRFDLEQREMFSGTVRALIATIDAKDPYTRGHSDRVSSFATLLARYADLGEEMIERARMCGLVHDIGKIGVPEEVLRKPSKLTEEEFAKIREHPGTGYRILKDIPQMRELLPGVLEHHERWDGRGYPGGLSGEGISLLGRMVCVADCFDAMTSARFYRPAREVGEVLEEIERCLGTHFDPKLGRVFLEIPRAELEAQIGPPVAPDA